MKKFLFVLFAIMSLISCEDTQTNEVALQAKIDDRLYTSTDARAAINADGTVTIQGFNDEESITLRLSRLDEGNFAIGEGTANQAIFEDMGGNVYTTNPNGEGVVTISELNETNKTLTGTFNFNAFLPGIDTIYVSRGTLYNVSYAGGEIVDPTNAGLFSAKVDGNPFIPVTVSSRNTGNTIITSGSTVNSTIVISVTANVEPGEYTLPRGGFGAKFQGLSGPEDTTDGLLTIIEHNTAEKTIKGTFSFITNRTEVTEGQFDVTYN
ncbi:DUF6252 family protein [Aequorivita vladivostokensis]|uniref:Lipoprotein n=1 Tax=Aequorivita vladivostokensis TaxID=171194 RepID=A0ABR5DFU6_9FLAO|nr:DUF6252 family protein [Aequorivita vladivostokensis]KJJ37635.1 hypothetical protein MB09_12785 [Aequorivita vladivostokensis]MAB56178.1 hypothetical protein [Aequorivita sp.]MAO48271.1 hypothetical protein [Aequorivita sp.]MBF31559.1 hypothetical protein [Aequorivita sp.]|tara:strand:- start:10116 stop:10913 length:798 start_codon:yes stop_codon:yes gene_type:complete